MVNGQSVRQIVQRSLAGRVGGTPRRLTVGERRAVAEQRKAVKLRKGGTGVIILNEVDRQLLGISKRGGVL